MQAAMINKVQQIDSSVQRGRSVSGALGDEVERRLHERHPALQVEWLDVADRTTHIEADRVAAKLTAEVQRRAVVQRDTGPPDVSRQLA